MTRTALVYDDFYLRHETGTHVETPKRLEVMVKKLKGAGLWGGEDTPVLKPERADESVLMWSHSPELVDEIRETCRRAEESRSLLHLDADTVVSAASFESSLLAVGGCFVGIDAILEGEVDNGFAMVRPPGHHTNRGRARGFCLFNNVALAAEYLLRKKGLKRVAIVDVDCHHGNGTQDIFWENSEAGDVLFASTHQDGRTLYPGSGFVHEIGEGRGEGRVVNVPQPPTMSDASVKRVRDEVLAPILRDFRPQFLLCSIGFDALYSDPITNLAWTVQGYGEFVAALKGWAEELCEGRLLLTLEGGYDLKNLARASLNVVCGLTGRPFLEADARVQEDPRIKAYVAEQLLPKLKSTFSKYYPSLRDNEEADGHAV
ncbi:MAG: histone deacetylase [Promethearchaeota archaeon]